MDYNVDDNDVTILFGGTKIAWEDGKGFQSAEKRI